MNKNNILMCIIGIGSIISSAYAGSACQSYPGSYICDNGVTNSIHGTYGSIILKNMQIDGDIKATAGSLNITKSHINNIDGQYGSIVIEDSSLSGKLAGVIGEIYISNSSLDEDTNIVTPSVVLKTTHAKNLFITNTEKKIKLKIINNSVINGNITFDTKPGEICIDSNSVIHGQIINGDIVKGC